MNYYCRTNPNKYARAAGYGDFWGNASRPAGADVEVVVVHTAESLPDFTPPDSGAESVAAFFASTLTRVSAHAVSDSDTVVPFCPTSSRAWHVAGFNSTTVGLEIATQAHTWDSAPKLWVSRTVDNAALVCALWARRYSIPAVRLTRAQVQSGGKGFAAHGDLNPADRTDPGVGFPWTVFLNRVADYVKLRPVGIGDFGDDVKAVQGFLAGMGDYFGAIDGAFGPITDGAVRDYQGAGSSVTGIILAGLLPGTPNPEPEPTEPEPITRVIELAPGESVTIRA